MAALAFSCRDFFGRSRPRRPQASVRPHRREQKMQHSPIFAINRLSHTACSIFAGGLCLLVAQAMLKAHCLLALSVLKPASCIRE